MWRYPLRRAYFGLVGLLLFTLPVFAGLRYMEHQLPVCVTHALECIGLHQHGLHDGRFYAVWQGGPIVDVWPAALVLLGLAVAVDATMMARARLRR